MADYIQAIHLAAWDGDVMKLRQLLNEDRRRLYAIDPWGLLPLGLIAQKGHLDAAHCLLEYDVDLDRKDERGSTALMWACCRGQVKLAQQLLTWGADPTILDIGGGNALMDAASGQGPDADVLVALLLADGRVDVDHRNDAGATALSQACRAGNVEVVRRLVMETRAKHDIPDAWGQKPLSTARACMHMDCVELLEWLEGELERAYWLAKARRVEEDQQAYMLVTTNYRFEDWEAQSERGGGVKEAGQWGQGRRTRQHSGSDYRGDGDGREHGDPPDVTNVGDKGGEDGGGRERGPWTWSRAV